MDWFSPIDPSKKNSEFIAVESKSFWKAAWGRFKKNPMAVLGLVVILLLAVVSIFGPMISPMHTMHRTQPISTRAFRHSTFSEPTNSAVMYLQDSATEAASAWRLVLEQPSSTPYSVW